MSRAWWILVIAALASSRSEARQGALNTIDELSRLESASPVAGAGLTPDRDAPSLDWSAAWPERLIPAEGARGIGVVALVEPAENARNLMPFPKRRRAGAGPKLSPESSAAARRLVGPDAVLADAFGGEGSFEYDFVPAQAVGPSPDPVAFFFEFQSARGDVSSPQIDRTWFAWYDPAAKSTPGRPVVVFLPGMFGTPEPMIVGLIKKLRSAGYPVLRMLAHPARFVEREAIEIDPDDPRGSAERLSETNTQRVAECAFAVEGAFAYLEAARPALKDRARVAIGFSGGAMVLPTVVAREPAKYAAAALIGGGCDFFLIIETSNYTGWIDAVRHEWTRPPTPEEALAVDAAYLGLTPLDGYHTSAALRGKPVLGYIGSADRAVPAGLGEVQLHRAGASEIWREAQGHEGLFMALPFRYDELIAWLDRAVPPDPAR